MDGRGGDAVATSDVPREMPLGARSGCGRCDDDGVW